jgi:osmotically-inducible protein OsmY
MKAKLFAVLLAAAVLPALQGCFTAFATGVGAGIMIVLDRRTLGTQTEDEAIEWKAESRIDEKLRERGHFNFTSYNRKVLISGEAVSAEVKAEVGAIVAQIPNVQGLYNELVVRPLSSLAARSNDSFITSKVKSRSVDNGKFNPMHVKVVTESATVFLLGMLTQAEAGEAIRVARTTSGVTKVVSLFEIISPAQARKLDRENATPESGKP